MSENRRRAQNKSKPSKDKPTIHDVAKVAGVSIATVSNILNGKHHKVSQTTRQRVMAVVESLNYQVDLAARSLINRKSGLIGIILPAAPTTSSPKNLLLENPFYYAFICGAQFHAQRHGYDLVLTSYKNDPSTRNWINQRNLEGVILMGIYPDELFSEIQVLGIPVVVLDTYGLVGDPRYGDRLFNIGIDDALGGYLAVKHLAEQGHQKIALAPGNTDWSEVNKRRMAGFQQALEEFGLTVDPTLVFNQNISLAGGREVGQHLIDRTDQVTALATVSDIVAIGFAQVFLHAGRSIPEDLSLVGFDDLPECQYLPFGLTTIRQDIHQKGIAAVDLVIQSSSGSKPPSHQVQPIELIVRDSTRSV